MNSGTIQHAYNSIYYDTATYQPSVVTEGLPDNTEGPVAIIRDASKIVQSRLESTSHASPSSLCNALVLSIQWDRLEG